jgi:hypothetical protein
LEMETARHMEERPGSDSGSDSESDWGGNHLAGREF